VDEDVFEGLQCSPIVRVDKRFTVIRCIFSQLPNFVVLKLSNNFPAKLILPEIGQSYVPTEQQPEPQSVT
jgi:hypothetical protein